MFIIYMKEGKNVREDFEKLNFEAQSERWFEKILRLAIYIWFL